MSRFLQKLIRQPLHRFKAKVTNNSLVSSSVAKCFSTGKSTLAPKVERVVDSVELGEGPHWDEPTQTLYFVDIFGKAIHKYVPATKKHAKALIGTNHVTLIIPVAGQKDKFLISIGRELYVVTWDGKSDKVSSTEKVFEVDNKPDTKGNRFNDGKCDKTGRLWAGTMGRETDPGQVEPEKGSLYSFGPNKNVKTHRTKIGLSNGIAWSPDFKQMYYIDTSKGTVDQYDYDMQNGSISNLKVVFTVTKSVLSKGLLDGMCIDTDGNLWVAVYNTNTVIKIDPRKPETILQQIKLPAQEVTSVTFGGSNLDQLYVTSAKVPQGGKQFPPPDHGATYVITGTGSKGFPGIPVKL